MHTVFLTACSSMDSHGSTRHAHRLPHPSSLKVRVMAAHREVILASLSCLIAALPVPRFGRMWRRQIFRPPALQGAQPPCSISAWTRDKLQINQ
jgi:hypothetical protein